MVRQSARAFGAMLPALMLGATAIRAAPASAPAFTPRTPPSYADLVDLVDSAPLILEVRIRKVAPLEAARAPGVRPGWARIYVEAQGIAALRGALPVGAGPGNAPISYLADVPLDPRGKLPDLKKQAELLMARAVPDRPGGGPPTDSRPAMVQLIAPDAQLPWSADLEARVRGVMAELAAPGAPGPISGVREAIYVPGTLAGEGETQIFLSTTDGSPASISVVHAPGKAAVWTVSFSEVVDASGEPPAHDTLEWYRLACTLPRALPAGVNVSETGADKAQADEDYRLVKTGLGDCGRKRM